MPSLSIDTLLSINGPVSRVLGRDFESRPEQLTMARAVSQTLAERSHLLVEAGTGVGKSFAYLAPAMLRAALHGETVLIATNTIALQEQLISKDVPLLQAAIENELTSGEEASDHGPQAHHQLKAVLVKGRGNYVSIRRMHQAIQRADKLVHDQAARRSLMSIAEWASTTKDGTISSLPQIERAGVWDKVQSDSGNCMGRRCSNYNECFYQSARREMEGANILICNHALFFSDLALRAQEVGFLPRYDHVILDEAHNLEDVASEHFGTSLSEGRVFHLLSTLYSPRSGKGYLAQLALLLGDTDAVNRAIGRVTEADTAARQFFELVAQFATSSAHTPDDASSYRNRAAPPNATGGEPATRRIHGADAFPNPLSPAMRELTLCLRGLKDIAKNEPDKFELNALSIRAEEISLAADTLVSQSQPHCVYWAETGGIDESRFQRVTLACAPIEIAPVLRERLFAQEHSVVLTSATLATRSIKSHEATERAETAFAHTLSRLGAEGAKTLQLGSPFDYANQVEFFVDQSAPDSRRSPRPGNTKRGASDDFDPSYSETSRPRTYAEALSDRILFHVKATDGGAFVLFTSFATLNAVARVLSRELSRLDMPLLVQGQSGSRTAILDQFRTDHRSVLLGAASFWQGVDVRGRGLRNVIITKLPFDPPDRPLTAARTELIESKGGDAFREDSLPRAVIKFKQGFGRLIRSHSDHGRVVVLDPRLITARYGRTFLDALPPGVEVKTLTDQFED
jgi:ATP-dependent DNA helicase DinG